jgi:RHS repeat-associated protein
LRRTVFSSVFTLLSTCWCLAGAGAAHAQFPNLARGFSPSGIFDVGGIDVVNGFNGNMVIRIPIGKTYPVGGTMGSYSFSLIYNSKVWDFHGRLAVQCTGLTAPIDTLAEPSPHDNAGLGWRFSLGRLDGDQPDAYLPNPPTTHTYHGMDGSEHYLFDYLYDQLSTGPGTKVQESGMQFSNDGSYLRYSAAKSTIEFPDGNVHTFDANGFPTSIKDQFGNGLTITYTTDPRSCPGNANGPGSVWQISDGYRTHKVCLYPTGYASPEQTQVIDHFDLAAFGTSTPATYKFLYNNEDANGNGFQQINLVGTGTMIRGCTGTDPGWNPPVYLLTKLLLPDGTSYSMPAAAYQQSFPGQLTSMGLPTSGSIAWTYEPKALPSPHSDDNSLWYIPVWSSVIGVKQRSLYDTSGQLIGTWQYTGAGVPVKANELVNQVVFPSPDPVQAAQGASGHRIVTYYSGCVYGICQNEAGGEPPDTYAVDYGLPYSRRRPDGTGRYLAQEVYETASASTPLRQVFANYDNDEPPNPAPGSATSPVFANQRPQSQRTVYLDDPVPGQPGNYTAIATTSSNYDGLGHYRIATTSDNIRPGTSRTERTDWNPNPFGMQPSAPPGPTASWILDTYDFKEQQEGAALIRQETLFDGSKGFLLCERRLRSGATHGPNDVIVAHQPNSAGQVAFEQWFGGDSRPLLSGQDCGSLPSSPAYSYSHFYAAGVRHLTQTQVTVTVNNTNTLTTLNLLDADIDAPSGLVSASRDPAGRTTTFTYDSMARPLTSTPPGAATTNVTYHLSSLSPPFIDRSVGSPVLEHESWLLDGLGRTVQHTTTLPGNVASTSLVTLNAMGWKIFESEPSSSPGTKRTHYLDYDPFGRPGMIVAADGMPTNFTYHGVRRLVRTQRVWNGTREVPVNTTEEYDGLGRLRKVIEPDGTVTRYAYDAGGRLNLVTNNASGTYQTRMFHYDGRGFLTRETYPEIGNAATTYHYDAKGNVTRKATPTGTLLYAYDEAGRPLSVGSPQVGSPQVTTLRQFSYGTGSTAGALIEASAFNWRMGSVCSSIEVRQDFSYDSPTGRLSSEDTSLWQGGPLEHWTQSYAYDGADRITQVSYPNCVSACSSTPRQVTTTYSQGRPTAVSGFANPITYHDNGTLATIQHANGVVFTETPDLSGIPRPGSLRADLPSAQPPTQPWPREDYFYDGSGNIKAIGGKSFAYDVNSRIVSAIVPTAGAQPYQAYGYDVFGNLALVYRGASPSSATYVSYYADAGTNRLTGAMYDNSGEVTSVPGTTFNWTWDVLGQATSVTTDTESWIHTYDAAGERVWSRRTSPSRLDTYALRGQDRKLLSLFTKTGSTYTWEDYAYREGSLLGAAFSDGSVRHFDVDHLGSVRLETSGVPGAPPIYQPKYRDFWPYGEEATPPGGSERMKFAGQERDLGNLTGTADDIDYMHARYFRPIWGRFLTVDPAGGNPKIPRSWNRYAYVRDNPLIFVDPNGDVVDLSDLTDAQQQELLQKLADFTGNVYNVDEEGNLAFVSAGSSSSPTATSFLNDAIDSDNIYPVVSTNGINRWNDKEEQVEINFSSFTGADYGRVDPRSFNLGSTLVHELRHAVTGEEDTVNGVIRMATGWTGPVVDYVNKIRAERGLPQRESYIAVRPLGTNKERYQFNHVDPRHPEKIFYVIRNPGG